jgi:DNA-binding NtrC family response regulator
MNTNYNKHILLIDDSKDILLSVTIALAGLGIEISYVNSMEAALERITGGPHFDLIILDIMMPNDSGLRCLDRFREMKVTTPILVYSAKSDWSTCRSAFIKGANDYLAKSVLNHVFLAAVNRLLYDEHTG